MPVPQPFKAILLFAPFALAASSQPTVSAVYRSDPPAIAVIASDATGLDSLELSCPALDLTYKTQLARVSAEKRFERSFALRDVFPSIDAAKEAVRVTVTVRNTRGSVASTIVAVPPASSAKPN